MIKRVFDKIRVGIEEAIANARREADLTTSRLHGDADSGSQASMRDLADRTAALTPKVSQTDSTELVREDRAR